MEGVRSQCHNATVSEKDGKVLCDVCRNECPTNMSQDENAASAADHGQSEAAAPTGEQTADTTAAPAAGEGEGQGSAAPEGEQGSAEGQTTAPEGTQDGSNTGEAPAAGEGQQ